MDQDVEPQIQKTQNEPTMKDPGVPQSGDTEMKENMEERKIEVDDDEEEEEEEVEVEVDESGLVSVEVCLKTVFS